MKFPEDSGNEDCQEIKRSMYHVSIRKYFICYVTGDKTLGGVRLREKKYHFHLGHYNNNSFVGKPKDLAVHV